MKNLTQFLKEGKRKSKKDYEIYHKSFTDAWNEVQRFVLANDYTMDQNDVDTQVTHGGVTGRARPSVGKTNKFSIRLMKNGQETRKTIQFQVYGMGGENGTFELNMYVG